MIVGSNIGTYLDQLWVSSIVKFKHNKEVTNKNPRGWSLPIPIDIRQQYQWMSHVS